MQESDKKKKSALRARGLDLPFVAVCALGIAEVVAFYLRRAGSLAAVNEDAYISFRYARNLLRGDGLVFNPGERVEGMTNLLWTLLLAGGSWVSGVSLPQLSLAFGTACGVLVVGVSFWWCYTEVRPVVPGRAGAALVALAAPAVLVAIPGFAFYSVSGLEVAFFALLLTGGLFAVLRGGTPYAVAFGSVLLGLATVTRPEGALVLAFAALGAAFAGRDASLRGRFARLVAAGLPGGLVVLGFTLFRVLYYGSVLPNTAYAKAGGMEVVERWGIPYVMEAARGNLFAVAWLLILAGALVDRGFLFRSLAVVAITPVWAAYLVYAGGDYMPFHRLIVPLLPPLFVLGVAGFVRVALYALPQSSGRALALRPVAASVLALALMLPFLLQYPDQVERERASRINNERENERRAAMAEWFRQNDPNALVARNGVGVFGFYTETRIVDMLGLNDRHIARHGEKHPRYLPGHQASDADYVLSRKPEYIMVTNTEPRFRFAGDRDLVNSEELHRDYELIEVEISSGHTTKMFRRQQESLPDADAPEGEESARIE